MVTGCHWATMDTGALMHTKILAAIMVLSGVVALSLPVDAPALAAPIVSMQARAANASFLAYVPPPASVGSMCLVDTGVDPIPDVSPTLVHAAAIDGGNTNDNDPEGHGTLLAILAGGQGHGLRGIWPQIKIVSIRATSPTAPGQDPIYQYENYVQGLTACLQQFRYNIKTVNLSLSSAIAPTPDQSSEFAQGVRELTSRGIAIVAAAGNTPGKVQYPGAEPGVLSIGAGTSTGGTCSFSANEGVGLFAPGCGLDFADPFKDQYAPTEYVQGTSEASVIAAASLTALLSYAPTLTVAQAENLLVTTAVAGHLNVAGAFEAAGLGSVVAAGNAAIPPEPPAVNPPPPSKAKAPHRTSHHVRHHNKKRKRKKRRNKGHNKKRQQTKKAKRTTK